MREVIRDNFEGANGTPLANHTPNIGPPWNTIWEGWELGGNRLVCDSNFALSNCPVGFRIGSAQAVITGNGANDGANQCQLALGAVGVEQIQFRAGSGDGTVSFSTQDPGNSANNYVLSIQDPGGNRAVGIFVGPGKAICTLNGKTYELPRANNTVPLDDVIIGGFGNVVNCPFGIQDLTVFGAGAPNT